MKVIFLTGKKIYLRPVDIEQDIDLFYKGENDPLVRDALFLALPVTREGMRKRLNDWLQGKEVILFAICEHKTDRAVGVTAFFRIDYVNRVAIFYLAILEPSEWSKGYGSEATKLMIDYAFAALNLNRIQLHVCAENIPAIKIYQKLGFSREGVLRQAMYRRGAFVDFWVMGILKEEWQGAQERQ